MFSHLIGSFPGVTAYLNKYWAPFRCNLELLHRAIWGFLTSDSSSTCGDLRNDLRLVQNAPYPPILMPHGGYIAEPVIWSQNSGSWSSYIGLYEVQGSREAPGDCRGPIIDLRSGSKAPNSPLGMCHGAYIPKPAISSQKSGSRSSYIGLYGGF